MRIKNSKFIAVMMLSLLVVFGSNPSTLYAHSNHENVVPSRAPGDYGSYYTYKSEGYVGKKYGKIVKYLTNSWDYIDEYKYGPNQNFSVGVSFGYNYKGANVNVYGDYSSSFSVTSTKYADGSRRSKLAFISDFNIEKIKQTYYRDSKPVSSKYIYKAVPIRGSERTKIIYK